MKRRTFTAMLAGVIAAPFSAIKGMVGGGDRWVVTGAWHPNTYFVKGLWDLLLQVDDTGITSGRYIFISMGKWGGVGEGSPIMTEYRMIDFDDIRSGQCYIAVDIIEGPAGRHSQVERWITMSDPFVRIDGLDAVEVQRCEQLWRVCDHRIDLRSGAEPTEIGWRYVGRYHDFDDRALYRNFIPFRERGACP